MTTSDALPANRGGNTVRILFLAAQPDGSPPTRFGDEFQIIKEAIRGSGFRERFAEPRIEPAARWTDLSAGLRDYRPHIVHFSGHGERGGELVFLNETGTRDPVLPEDLSDLLRLLRGTLRCVVINACWSEAQAKAITSHVDFVIGMSQPVQNPAAILFAKELYGNFGSGLDIQTAFDVAALTMGRSASGIGREITATGVATPTAPLSLRDVPRLLVREGANPSSFVFAFERPDKGVVDDLARRMIAARSSDELRRILFELEEYLAQNPHMASARGLQHRLTLALKQAERLERAASLLLLRLELFSPFQRDFIRIMIDADKSPEERAEAGRKLAEIGDPRPGVGLRPDGLPDIVWCEVPTGEFTMGGARYDDEKPVRKRSLPAFQIAKYLITYVQYKVFLDAKDGYRNKQWWVEPSKLADRVPEPGKQHWPTANHPAENVSWFDAVAFCRWLTVRLRAVDELGGREEIRLPTEKEWEKAARGTDGREYPWGNTYVEGFANIDEAWGGVGRHNLGRTSAVGIYLHGESPNGVLDMAGNVWEWTSTKYDTGQEDDRRTVDPQARRVVRGGSWYHDRLYARAAYRGWNNPDNRHFFVGVRVGRGSSPISSKD